MAIYRLEAKIFSRERRGRSIIAAAAYRAGSRLRDAIQDKVFDYSRRMKGVVETAVLTPQGAPEWGRDSERLWNTVEAGEKRKDAQLAREFILAVPRELDAKAQFAVARDWASKELVARGMAVEVSLHYPRNGKNPHVHLLATLRKLEPEGFSPKKPREWNEVGQLHQWRESWADAVNSALEKAGRPERVDHRSLKDRGIDAEPQPKIGVAATAMQREGKLADPERVQAARRVKLINEVRPMLRAIRKSGEVRQHGVGASWWEKSITFMHRVREVAKDTLMKTWRSIIGRTKDDGPER